MPLDKISIGTRLREFGESLYGKRGMTKFAEVLGMTPGALSSSYLSGRSIPGGELMAKLINLGCDVNWLLSGETSGRKYIPLAEAEKNHIAEQIEYKIVANVPAGIAEVHDQDWYETAPLDYNPDDHAFIRVDEEFGYSMMPTIGPGDLVLINFRIKPKNGDLVAARWDETKGALKIYSDNPDIPDMAVLTSYNQAIPPIFVSMKKVKLYKVVLIKKNR